MERAPERRGGGRTRAVWLALGLALTVRAAHAQIVPDATAIRQSLDAGAYSRAEELALKWVVFVDGQRHADPLPALRARDLLVEARVKNGKSGSAATLTLARGV